MSGRRAFLAGAAGVLPVGAAAPLPVHPDAALLALCGRLAEMQAEWRRLYDLTSEEPELKTPADFAWQAYSDDTWPRVASFNDNPALDVPAELLRLYATTPDGLRAKAAAVLALEDAAAYCDARDDSWDLHMSVVRDAAALAG